MQKVTAEHRGHLQLVLNTPLRVVIHVGKFEGSTWGARLKLECFLGVANA